jgi:DNA damage-binding protein 1
MIAIADLMKSLAVVEYTKGEAGLPDKLVEVARHYQTTWATSVAEIDTNTFLESDAEGNLMVLYRDPKGVTDDDKRRLNVSSEMLLGEMVNRIRRIDVLTTPDAAVVPRAFVGTVGLPNNTCHARILTYIQVEGSIYLFGLISPTHQNLLMTLQSNLGALVETPGDMIFAKFRAFKNTVREEEEPMRFVDGELVERFLDVSEDIQREAIAGLGVELEEVKGMIEGLRRLH